MCGINGIVLGVDESHENISHSILSMNDAISYRGPDSSGYYISHCNKLAMGHVRLAILDLSESGHQPMKAQNDQYILTFNGEIYNFIELREELIDLGCVFNSTSDTEVLLKCIIEFGIVKALPKLKGMFAFALYDSLKNTLIIARDSLGEKPLYYGVVNGDLYYSSELTAIERIKTGALKINATASEYYFAYGFVPGDNSIYTGIKKLDPGSYLSIEVGSKVESDSLIPQSFKVAPIGSPSLFDLDYDKAVHKLDLLLQEVVQRQKIADVPLGSFLSGGIDSSLVTSILQSQQKEPVETFTIAFDESKYDESEFAKEIASHIGANFNEIRISENELLSSIDRYIICLDEPFANASSIPAFILANRAKQKVSVCMSGDGGDELFLGYNRYLLAEKIASRFGNKSEWSRKSMSSALRIASTLPLDSLVRFSNRIRGKSSGVNYKSKVSKLAQLINSKDGQDMYRILMNYCEINPVLEAANKSTALYKGNDFDFNNAYIESAAEWDVKYYLPGDCLYKTDRAAMKSSLEVRVPLLDLDIVSFANALPIDYKIRGGKTKSILRSVLSEYIPQDLYERPKMGFTVPLVNWINSVLYDEVDSFLSKDAIRKVGVLDYDVVKSDVRSLRAGKEQYANAVWAYFIFQKWAVFRGW